MGMAASQARLLSITSRIADNELRAQIINNSKMRLATDSSRISEEYVTALNDAVMMISNHDVSGNEQYQQLTYNALTSYSSYNNQYGLINSSGQILVSESEANLFKQANGDVNKYLALHGLENSTSYFTPETFGLANENAKLEFKDVNGNVYASLTANELAAMYKQYGTNTNSVEFSQFNDLYTKYQVAYDAYRPELTKAVQSYLQHFYSPSNVTISTTTKNTATDDLLSRLDVLLKEPENDSVDKGVIYELCSKEQADELKKLVETNYINTPTGIDDIYLHEEQGRKWLVRAKSGTNGNKGYCYANGDKSEWSNQALAEWNEYNNGHKTASYQAVKANVCLGPTMGTTDQSRGLLVISNRTKESHADEQYVELNRFYVMDLLNSLGVIENNGNTWTIKGIDGTGKIEATGTSYECLTRIPNNDQNYWEIIGQYIQIEFINGDIVTDKGKQEPNGNGVYSGKTLVKVSNNQYDITGNKPINLNVQIKYRTDLTSDSWTKERYFINTNSQTTVMQVLSDAEVQAIYAEKYNTVYNSIGTYYDFDTVHKNTRVINKLNGGENNATRQEYITAANNLNNFLFSNLTDEEKKELQSKYSDLGVLFSYISENSKYQTKANDKLEAMKSLYILDQLYDIYGEPQNDWTDTNSVDGDNASAKAQWYINLFERMQQGYAVIEKGLASSQDWIKNAFKNGQVTVEMVNKTNKWTSTSYSNISNITEVTDEKAVAIAEAEYKKAMNKIENKDKRYDMELKNIDTEHNSLQQEYDSIKSVISKNIERTFKMYS